MPEQPNTILGHEFSEEAIEQSKKAISSFSTAIETIARSTSFVTSIRQNIFGRARLEQSTDEAMYWLEKIATENMIGVIAAGSFDEGVALGREQAISEIQLLALEATDPTDSLE